MNRVVLRLLYVFPSVAWMIFLFYLSSQPALPGPASFSADFFLKKIAHLSFYACLFLLYCIAVEGRLKIRGSRPVLCFLLVFLYASFDEFHQSLIPGRQPALRDIAYDSFGAFIAWLALIRKI